jgi:predicted  nucleic acid-binding Zn-ribbon protein
MNMTTRAKKAVAASALLLSGLGIGAAVAGTTSATAATSAVTATAADTVQSLDPSKPMRSDEQLLTGTTAAKVKAAALAKYPNATIQRVETDSDGVYEAHIVTSAGDQVIVQVGKDFAVTGTQTGGGHGPADTTAG